MTDTQFWITFFISAFLAVLIVKPIATKVLRHFGMENEKNTPFVVQMALALIVFYVWLGIFYLIRFLLTGATSSGCCMVMTDTQFFITLPISTALGALIVHLIATKVLRRFNMELYKNTPFVVNMAGIIIFTFVWMSIFYLIRYLLTGATDRATLFQ